MRKFTKTVYLRVYFLFFLTYSSGSNASLKVHSIITVGMIGPRSILLFFLCRFPGLSLNFKWIHDSLDWDVWRFNAKIRSIFMKFDKKFRINFERDILEKYKYFDYRVMNGNINLIIFYLQNLQVFWHSRFIAFGYRRHKSEKFSHFAGFRSLHGNFSLSQKLHVFAQ